MARLQEEDLIRGNLQLQFPVWSHHLCSTFRQDCNFSIRLALSEDGQHLRVVYINEQHNHDVIEVSGCTCKILTYALHFRQSMITFHINDP